MDQIRFPFQSRLGFDDYRGEGRMAFRLLPRRQDAKDIASREAEDAPEDTEDQR